MWREPLSWDEIDFPCFTLLGLVKVIKTDEFFSQLDAAYLVETRVVPDSDLGPPGLPGLSGGPGFFVSNNPAVILAPQLCGIVKEGWTPREGADEDASVIRDNNVLVRFARLDRVDRSGAITAGSG